MRECRRHADPRERSHVHQQAALRQRRCSRPNLETLVSENGTTMHQSVSAWPDDGTTLATAPTTCGQQYAAATLCVLFTLATMVLMPIATRIHAPVPAFVRQQPSFKTDRCQGY